MNNKTLINIGIGVAGLAVLLFVLWFALGSKTHSIERTQESVKLVFAIRSNGVLSFGSAFVINDEGCLVTNAHVAGIEDEKTGIYSMPTPEDFLYVVYDKQTRAGRKVILQRAIVEHMDASRDLALLRVNPDRASLRPLRLGKSVQIGQVVRAMGYPTTYKKDEFRKLFHQTIWDQVIIKKRERMENRIELDWTSKMGDLLEAVSVTGSITSLPTAGGLDTGMGRDATARVIKHSATVAPGMSGGPVVSSNGDVVGVTYSRNMDDGANVNCAIAISELHHFLAGRGLTVTDPTSIVARLRALVNNAKPYEIALSILGIVVAAGAVIALIFLIVGKGGRNDGMKNDYGGGQGENGGSVGETQPFEREKPTMPFSPKQPQLSVVLSGTAPNGQPLRFRFTQSDLQTKHSKSLLVGRSRRCDIQLPDDPHISRQQARFLYEEDARGNGYLYIKDENSTNTTCVNGTPIQGKCPIYNDDRITFGPVELVLAIEG